MTQPTLFDREAGIQAKEQGISRACSPYFRKELLTAAREAATNISQVCGEVTIDDVYSRLIKWGKNPEALGNASGAVFAGPAWECIGWKQSERKSNHHRAIRVWRLK